MARLEIFESAAPAATGDDTLARDLAALEARGIAVARHQLDRDRAAFEANELVRGVLESQGAAALPLVLVDNAIVGAGAYPSRPELARALGLSTAGDEDLAAALLAGGTTLGLALARHDAAAIEAVYAGLKQLGVTRLEFAQAVRALIASSAAGDPQVAEALDRLAARGTLRPPGGPCCG